MYNRSLKYAIGLAFVMLLRLLPHPPNVEPITAALMPFARGWGVFSGVLFGVSAVLIYDLITGTFGTWSFFTMGAYALLGIGAGLYFRYVTEHSSTAYIGFAIIGTLFFDILTGLLPGPLFFNQPLVSALIGQIPFTLYHLAGNIVLAGVVSPLLYRWVVGNEQLETTHVVHEVVRRARVLFHR